MGPERGDCGAVFVKLISETIRDESRKVTFLTNEGYFESALPGSGKPKTGR
jgi:hypothetical protein